MSAASPDNVYQAAHSAYRESDVVSFGSSSGTFGRGIVDVLHDVAISMMRNQGETVCGLWVT